MNVRIRWSFYLLRFKDFKGIHIYIEKSSENKDMYRKYEGLTS